MSQKLDSKYKKIAAVLEILQQDSRAPLALKEIA